MLIRFEFLYIKILKFVLNKIEFFAYFDNRLKFSLFLLEFNFYKSSNFKEKMLLRFENTFLYIFLNYIHFNYSNIIFIRII